MKKILLVMAAGAIALASCSGNKAEASAENASEQTVSRTEQTKPALPKISDDQKKAIVNSGLAAASDFAKPVIIDFNATWCGPCRQFAPYFEAAAEKNADKAKFLSVDVDVYGEVAGAFGVQSIPTVIIILPNGEYVTYVGTQDIIGEGVFEGIVANYTK